MVALVLNGQSFDVTGETMRDVLLHASGRLDKGHAISRVVVDGNETPGYMEDSFLASSALQIRRVEVESQSVKDLVLKGVNLEGRFLTELCKDLPRIALAFRKSEATKASENLIVIADGLKSLVQVLQSVSTFFPEFYKTFVYDEKSVDAHLRDFSGILESIHIAQTQSDWVMLADIIEYELTEKIRNWGSLLDQLTVELSSITPSEC